MCLALGIYRWKVRAPAFMGLLTQHILLSPLLYGESANILLQNQQCSDSTINSAGPRLRLCTRLWVTGRPFSIPFWVKTPISHQSRRFGPTCVRRGCYFKTQGKSKFCTWNSILMKGILYKSLGKIKRIIPPKVTYFWNLHFRTLRETCWRVSPNWEIYSIRGEREACLFLLDSPAEQGHVDGVGQGWQACFTYLL